MLVTDIRAAEARLMGTGNLQSKYADFCKDLILLIIWRNVSIKLTLVHRSLTNATKLSEMTGGGGAVIHTTADTSRLIQNAMVLVDNMTCGLSMFLSL